MASGSINSLSLEGIPFDVAGDADFSEVFSKFTNTVIATSGKGSISQEQRSTEVSGVVVVLKTGDKALIKGLAESGDEITITYVTRSGAKYSCLGTINIENNTTKENRTSLTLIPVEDWTESL